MLRPDQINDTSITRVKGMTGSVMDYNPINVAPKGQKQGDYASTTIGPYDYWAIEYAYTPVMGNEEAELKKIAARSPDPDLAFATDDDFMNNDPQVNTYDLTSDTLAYGKMRMAMASELLKDLDQKVVKDGESWARLRRAFMSCIQPVRQRGVPRGRIHRRPVGQPRLQGDRQGPRPDHARSPAPASARPSSCWSTRSSATRRSSSRPALLRKLITESWQDSRFSLLRQSDYPIYQVILNIQEIVLDQCLDPGVLQRIQNQEMQSDPGSDPIKIAEVFRSLSDGHLHRAGAPPAGGPVAVRDLDHPPQPPARVHQAAQHHGPRPQERSLVRRLPLHHLPRRGRPSPPPDAKNLARLHLDEIGQKIDKLLQRKDLKIDDTTLAHLKEIRFRIDKVLKANLNANEP